MQGLATRVLEALDVPIVVLSATLDATLFVNPAARALVGEPLPRVIGDAAAKLVAARRAGVTRPPPMRVEVTDERAVHVRVLAGAGFEVVVMTVEARRDVEAFRLLEDRYGVSRRGYQIVRALRLGRTNRQIAEELGLSERTVAGHVQHLLDRFDVPNRTRLVDVIERVLSTRV